jgi:Meiotically up-regulated gene 113|tara:strand:- start:162 stop:686 length:525 start_codon:yes stop_codon:yes gene_type:complete
MPLEKDDICPVYAPRNPYSFESYTPIGLSEEFLDKLEALEKFEELHEAGRTPKLSPKQKSALLQAMHNAKYIYFVLSEDSGLVKIGKTKDIKKRFASLQTMSPVPLRIIGCFRAHDELEGTLHSRFAKYRHHGEWFKLSDEIVKLIELGVEKGVRALVWDCAQWVKVNDPCRLR